MKPNTASASVTLPAITTAPAGSLSIAQRMMPGVKVLAAASPLPALTLALVAAHVLECMLKAFLSRDGSDDAIKKPNVRHNLEAPSAMAARR